MYKTFASEILIFLSVVTPHAVIYLLFTFSHLSITILWYWVNDLLYSGVLLSCYSLTYSNSKLLCILIYWFKRKKRRRDHCPFGDDLLYRKYHCISNLLMYSCQSVGSQRRQEAEHQRPRRLGPRSVRDHGGEEFDVRDVSRAHATTVGSVSSVWIWRSTVDHSAWRNLAWAAAALL